MRPVFLCALLSACGFESTALEPTAEVDASASIDPPAVSGDAPTPVPLTPATFVEKLIKLECEQAFVCEPQYPSSAQQFDNEWGTDLNDCVVTDRDVLARDMIAAGITAGTLTFNPTSAATCLAVPGIPTNCSTLFADTYDWADACYLALLGHTPDGAACTTTWQCDRQSRCKSGTCSR